MRRQAKYSAVAAGILVLESAHELGRVVFDRPWPGTYPIGLHSDVISIFLCAVWLTAATLLLLKERRPKLAFPSMVAGIAATFALLAHAVVARVFGSAVAALNALVALALAVVLTQSFDRKGSARSWRPPADSATRA